MSRRVLLASNNRAKLAEMRKIASSYGLTVVSPGELDISLEVEETGRTFAENALLKANAFHALVGGIVLADDSGLIVDALDGEPGVYSARYGGPGASDDDRNRLVLERLDRVPEPDRTARFVAAIAVVGVPGGARVFEDTVEGTITRAPQGKHGFGYDPIFLYPEFGATLAQVDAKKKASVSHRGKAMARAAAFLASYT